jgi:Zn-dependent alcohol dehydrogenase
MLIYTPVPAEPLAFAEADASPQRTRGLVVRAPGARPHVETLLVDPPGPGEVRVRVVASGICHTDRLVVAGRSWWPDSPYVLGHEGAGIVESVGPGVDPARVGRPVLLAWKAPCGRCRFCARGDEHRCIDPPRAGPRIQLADGTRATPSLRVGSHAGLAVVPDTAAVDLPDDLPLEPACLLGCAVLTGVGAVRNSARVRPGERVVVFGCGGVGLSVVAGARVAGASIIVAIDPHAGKLEVARRMGATHTLRGTAAGLVEDICVLSAGLGVDHAFDAVGRGDIIVDALRCLDSGGVCTLVGTPDVTDTATVPLELLYLRRLGLRVSQYGDVLPARDVPALVDAWRAGELDLDALITRRLPLEDAAQGLAALEDGATIRSVLDIGGDDALA